MGKKRKRGHISKNLFCQIANVLAFGRKEELTEEQELGRQHVLSCSACQKEMEGLVRILQKEIIWNSDSLFDQEGNLIPEGFPSLSMEF